MENASAENRNNRFVRCSFRQSCSICGGHGHNSRTCDVERMREFELECATALINIEVIDDFESWLSNTYDYNILKAYAIFKCGVINSEATHTTCIHAIRNYINNKYRFQYVSESNDSEFVDDMEQIIFNRSQERDESLNETDVIAALTNDIYSNIYFETLMRTIQLQNYGHMMQSAFQEASLIRKYNIVIVIEKTELERENYIECGICYESYNKQDCVTFGCKHEFCKDCLIKSLQNEKRDNPCCAYCRTNIDTITLNKEEYKEEFMDIIL
jgi:hypothetical protein